MEERKMTNEEEKYTKEYTEEKTRRLKEFAGTAILYIIENYISCLPEERYFVPVSFYEAIKEEKKTGQHRKITEVMTPDTIKYNIFHVTSIEEGGKGGCTVKFRLTDAVDPADPKIKELKLANLQMPAVDFAKGFLAPSPRENIFILNEPARTEMFARHFWEYLCLFWREEAQKQVFFTNQLAHTLKISQGYPEKYDQEKMYAGYWAQYQD